MTDTKEQERNQRISLGRPAGRLELTKTVDSGMVRQSFSHGRSKSVAVEVKKKRNVKPTSVARQPGPGRASDAPGAEAAARQPRAEPGRTSAARRPVVLKPLTDEEKTARVRALADAKKVEAEARHRAEENARRLAAEEQRRRSEEEAAVKRQADEETRKKSEEEARRKAEETAARHLAKEEEERRRQAESEAKPAARVEAPKARLRRARSGPRAAGPMASARPGRGASRAGVWCWGPITMSSSVAGRRSPHCGAIASASGAWRSSMKARSSARSSCPTPSPCRSSPTAWRSGAPS
jgi:translation initiation factor IF-2